MNEHMRVIAAFQKSVKDKNPTLTKEFTAEEIRQALGRVENADRNTQWRQEMETKLRELDSIPLMKKQSKEKRLDLFVAFILGIVGTLVAQVLIKKLGLG